MKTEVVMGMVVTACLHRHCRSSHSVIFTQCDPLNIVPLAHTSLSPKLYLVLISSSVSAGLISVSVAEWLACWTQAQKGPGSNRSHDAVG